MRKAFIHPCEGGFYAPKCGRQKFIFPGMVIAPLFEHVNAPLKDVVDADSRKDAASDSQQRPDIAKPKLQ